MAKSQRSGLSYKNGYKAYKSQDRERKNKIKRLKRVVKKQPNNEVAKAALKRAESAPVKHVAGRRSSGHTCKNLHPTMGFENNHPTKHITRHIRNYITEIKRKPSAPKVKRYVPEMQRQLEELGFSRISNRRKKKHERKRKKTS